MVQVISTTPKSSLSPRAFHTASDPSTILYRQGGWPACSPMQCVTLIHHLSHRTRPITRLNLDHHLHTTLSTMPRHAHSDGPPPSPPSLKSFRVKRASAEEVTGGEHV
ncbi:hypothetical protein CFOL_v3_06167 [Cephalotus follicularis]|uniref:Uncharacterized protein n=1 Tax=Cephalotus follicularis TaxID=3775 RepID=A0A1Q3B424_CEPFO|nr:hypothetical protein CFOL_v3_06167 [Cephalotus follicularis]